MTTQKLYTSIQRCRKWSTLDAGVHVFGRMGWGEPVAMRVLEQILLHPCDDVV